MPVAKSSATTRYVLSTRMTWMGLLYREQLKGSRAKASVGTGVGSVVGVIVGVVEGTAVGSLVGTPVGTCVESTSESGATNHVSATTRPCQ